MATGCHTGIESTKTIKMNKTERKETAPSAEQSLISSLQARPLSEWSPGKSFLVTDNKASIVFIPSDGRQAPELKDRVLKFQKVDSRRTANGDREATILFSDDNNTYIYYTSRTPEAAAKELTGLDIPMVVDLELVDEAARLLIGRKVWTRTGLWYDDSLNPVTGTKFTPVEILDVRPGNFIFPLIVGFRTPTDCTGRCG